MLIRKLILENFGLFQGRTELELTPRERGGKSRPVVLVGGRNGAGKTTLLEALRLCLYGPTALGNRVSNREYENYLRHCVHRDEAALITLDYAAVGMQFEYAEHGEVALYDVERSWYVRDNGSVESNLEVLRNGEPLDELDQENADNFLRDLIPPGVSQLYFFDAEKIQQLADTDDHDHTLAESIRGLLGLDLVERLHSDLRTYSSRAEDSPGTASLQDELSELEARLAELNEQRVTAMRHSDESRSQVDQLRKELARSENRLAKEGGAFASKREEFKAEKKQLLEKVTELEDQLRSNCEQLLPFTLARPLCISLREQIIAEDEQQAWQNQERHLNKRIGEVAARLENELFPANARIGSKTREEIESRVVHLLQYLAKAPDDLPKVEMVHRLSEDQKSRLLGAIDRVTNDVPKQIQQLQTKLEKATRRLGKVEHSLKKIPDDDQLQPLLERMRTLHKDLAASAAEAERNDASVKQIDFQLSEIERAEKRLRAKIADAESGLDRRAMVARVRTALDAFSEALISKKAQELSEAVARRFAQLWRKGDIVRRIEIDPKDFSVTLRDRHDRVVPKDKLSAGEKQMYAISVLWGLSEVSGRLLPMVIDTPLGRLDGDHRRHLVEKYFPHASHQVIILSTDTEIDQSFFEDLAPAVGRSYRLSYEPSEGRTVVETGYFWKRKSELVYAD